MITLSDWPHTARAKRTRRRFLRSATLAGAGIALVGGAALDTPATAAACDESVQDILNLAYAVEHCAVTLYYTALTSPALLRNPKLAGASANPNAVARDGNAENCANLQAALDQEQKHAQILSNVGATSPYTHFYFPVSTFRDLGYTSQVGTFLWALDHLETACIAGYLTAIRRLSELGRPDVATLCARNLAVECEHRALYRVIAGDDPADNITLPVEAFPCVADARTFFIPYVTGRGFPPSIVMTPALAIPTQGQIARVVGRNRSG